VMFFTFDDDDVFVARRRSPALFRLRAECSRCFAASRRFVYNNERSMALVRAASPSKTVVPRRVSRANTRLRRAMVCTIDMHVPVSFIRLDTKQRNHVACPTWCMDSGDTGALWGCGGGEQFRLGVEPRTEAVIEKLILVSSTAMLISCLYPFYIIRPGI
jgi:hypothetical protein